MSFFMGSQRVVLSQLDYQVEDSSYKVIKLNTSRGLVVEVYRRDGDELVLVDSKSLADKKDAYYKFGEKKYNLFLKDINDDGQAEVILPSIDKNMKARLNVFRFDQIQEKLQKITQH